MRIIRSSDLPAVVLVKGRGVRALAIPENLPTSEVLELARLVLSASEYEELWHAVQSSARLDPPRAGPLGHGGGSPGRRPARPGNSGLARSAAPIRQFRPCTWSPR